MAKKKPANGIQTINAQLIPASKLKSISNTIISSQILTFKKDTVSWLKRKSIDLDNYLCRPILPGSGNHITVRIDSEERYTLSTTINNNGDGLLDNSKYRKKRKVTVDSKLGSNFLRSLRLSQMIIVAFSKRLGDENDVKIPSELIGLITSIEGIMDGESESNKEDLIKLYNSLCNTYIKRIEQLIDEFKGLVMCLNRENENNEYDLSKDLLGQEIETVFFDYSEDNNVNFSYYLGSVKPNKHNIQFVNNSIRFALKELFLPSDWLDFNENERYSGSLDRVYPPPKLKPPRDIKDDLYSKVISNCGPILDVLISKSRDDPENDNLKEGVVKCEKLMSDLEEKLTIDKLVMHPPSKLQEQLDDITLEFELFDQMLISLKNNLPGLFETLDQDNKENISVVYQKSSNVRFDISTCQQIIVNVRNLIREKASAKDIQHQIQPIEEQGRKFQSTIQETTHKKSELAELEEKTTILKEEMMSWKESVETQLSRVISDDSLLWIGLGQAGGQILRECMMYCLENLNDARCTALLRALGVNKEDQAIINNLIKEVHSSDKDKSKKAELAIKRIAHENLHILAINLGEEIDKLVLDDAPGYFIWGDNVEEGINSRVTRGKRNTLKLNTSGEGAGGRTGLGRAFGFKHHNEISDVMRDVGMNKGGRKPKHIVITHSFAGGSGSGMVLPVLQQVRRTFGGKAIIWVMSVGGGDAERKVASTFNTPFILSDVLQAHYDGIHAISDPISVSEWGVFKSTISRLRSAMNSNIETLINEFSGNDENENDIMSRFEQELKQSHRHLYQDKKNRVFQAIKIVNEAEFPYNIGDGIETYSSLTELEQEINEGQIFSNLDKILPSNLEQTKKFNRWCEIQELGGIRPALEMWLNWIECETDPLGYFIQGREREKQTKADDIDGTVSEQQFVPGLTSSHLKTLLANLCNDLNLDREEGKNVKKLPVGLIPLANVLERYANSGTNDEISEKYEKIKGLLNSYGTNLEEYNNLKEKLTGQIMSLSGASSDARIKSIVVSNAHLELGVNTTQDLQVSGSTYTVYNSVIFDLMLNIIAPRLPTEPGVFINTDAEEFDEQDLLTHTHPPLVVGILNQRDSPSLSEPPLVADTTRHNLSSGLPQVLAGILSRDVCNGINNPLKGVPGIREELQMFFLSMFGRRYLYALQHNPYNGIVDVNNSETGKLSDFVKMVIEKWDSEEDVFGLSPDLRNNISFSEGITSEHVGNMIYWFSLIDIKSFARMIARDATEAEQVEKQLDENGWSEMCPTNPELMDMQRYSLDSSLSRFIAQEKIAINENILMEVLPRIGIWNGSILRTVGASHLNSYLPIELLFNEGEYKINPENVNLDNIGIASKDIEQYRQILGIVLKMIKDNHELKNNGFLRESKDLNLLVTNELALSATNKMLEGVGLKLDYIKVSKRLRLTLHPRLLRYFSAFRDIPMKPNDLLLPARSAGASLARYLHADSPGEVLDSSIPPSGISSPTFVKGGEILNYMRYFGLLPDETRLSLVPLMRILLLGSGSSEEFKHRMASQAKLVGFNFEEISHHLEQILDEQQYDKLDVFNQPLAYCLQSEVIHNRLKITKLIAEQLSKSPPKNWSSNDLLGLKAWLEITNNEDILREFNGDEKLFGDGRESLSRLKDWLHELRSLTGMNILPDNNIEEENLEKSSSEDEQIDTVSDENSTIIAIKQLFFDISTTLSESIGQAEYMNREFDSRRVHFEMTGFSDRLMGIPDSLLLLIHDRSPKLEQDKIKLSVREGIEFSVGSLGDPKEYFTAADYGPTSCITMVFQRAPLASLVDEFKAALEDEQSGLSSRDPVKYQDITRLHPYIFLYNLLWLSAKINKWTSARNTDFIRSFQIPTKVIEQHYQDPTKIPSYVLSIETHESYRLGQVRMPKDDQRDFKNAIKVKEKGVRNIVPLIGLMALRHEEAGGFIEDKFWKEAGLNEAEYNILNEYSAHEISYLAKEIYLDPEEEKTVQNGDDSELAELLAGLGSPPTSEDNDFDKDDLTSRTKAWFKAYANWLKFTDDEENDLGSKTDDASLFNAGE